MGIWGSLYNIPKAIFYLLKGDYILRQAVGGTNSHGRLRTQDSTKHRWNLSRGLNGQLFLKGRIQVKFQVRYRDGF